MTSSTPKNMQYKNISGSVSTSQKSDGCQAKMKDGRKCGETKNLQIIQEFKRLYESKMQQIDDAAGGDCVQAKINLQREWINDLTDQNEMLVRVVEELEVEAAERVTMLEEKLENSAKCACENEKAAKEKDKKINELEERIKKINEMAEKNEEARKSCHQYAELKKKMDVEKEGLLKKIKTLEEDNETMKESIIKAKHKLEKLESKAEAYLEERDEIKRKHKESIEVISTLEQENRKSKSTLQTLEEEHKNKKNMVVKELEDYEKKHSECMRKLESLREELAKTKQENQNSLSMVQNLRDENLSQADMIAGLKEKLRKHSDRVPTISTGTTCKSSCKDIGTDSHGMEMKHVGIHIVPDTTNTATICDLQSELIATQKLPSNCVQTQAKPPGTALRSIACQSFRSESQKCPRKAHFDAITTVNSFEEVQETNVYGVRKPPILKKKQAVEILEILEPNTLDTYGAGASICGDPFGFVQSRYTTTADERQMREMLRLDLIDNQRRDTSIDQQVRELEVFRPRSCGRPVVENAEVLFNSQNMCQSSNDSLDTDNDILTHTYADKPHKSVKIDTTPKLYETSPHEEIRTEDDISGTYYSTTEEPEFAKTEVLPLEARKTGVKIYHASPRSRSPSSKTDEAHSRSHPTRRSSTRESSPAEDLKHVVEDLDDSVSHIIEKQRHSPKKVNTQGTNATENLQHVVQDINQSVTRMMEKTPNEKETRQKIAQLEAQIRAALKQKELDVELERQKRNQEVENLKMTINEMHKALQNKQKNTNNLQSAVELYTNSISVLEQSEERYKNEVAQQRVTIANLQEALVTTKQQLDDLRFKGEKDLEEKCILLDILDISLNDLEKQCYHYYNQYVNSSSTIDFLRDEILNLEVQKFDLIQDVAVLESRLLKYQQISKQYEGKYMGSECSEYCIKQDESVVTLAQDTISYTEDLQCQLAVIQTALKREQKINMVQANRIEELQNIIGAKNIELSRVNDAYQDAKSKMDNATSRNKMLEQSIQELQEQLSDMEMDNLYHDEKTDICHGELDMCLNNLQSVKFKLRTQFKAMCQKMQEHTQLQADFRIQANNADIFKRDLENTRIRCRDELIEIKHNMRDLKEKLSTSENKIESLNEQVKQSQALLIESSNRECKLKQDCLIRENQLTETIHSAQEEEMRLLDLVTQLEQQITSMKKELDCRDAQIEITKKAMVQLKSEEMKKQQLTQEEVNKLKNEMNLAMQQQSLQKAENEKLQKQMDCLKCCVHQNEAANKSVTQQLDKCLIDLKNIEAEKFFLEQRNAKLMENLDKLQATLQTRTESITTMELQLIDAKNNRDEICNESRNVVCNVRAWLEEQKVINEQLRQKLQKKNALIMKYEQERSKKFECNYCHACNPRQRGGSSQHNYFQNNRPILSRSPWSLDSRGSGSESPTSSVSSTPADWYEYEEVGYDGIAEESNPEMWIHRVESMTEELQRSNRYWKRKINDSEFMVTKDK